ncbi:MAG: hypothetical protein KHX20_10940 [Megasphaera sp.]|jgi:hypothetical protein|nr:hypothetical protein [Megasphaera sp.]
MMKKLNIFLWVVVFAYLIYAMRIDGPTTKLVVLFILGIVAAAAQYRNDKKRREEEKKE